MKHTFRVFRRGRCLTGYPRFVCNLPMRSAKHSKGLLPTQGVSASGRARQFLTNPTFLRRLILVSLVGLALFNVLGCASVDRQCDMRVLYEQSRPAPTHGEVRIAWAFGQPFTGNVYGVTAMTDKAIVSLRDTPDFRDPCSLARLGHEILHAMGGSH